MDIILRRSSISVRIPIIMRGLLTRFSTYKDNIYDLIHPEGQGPHALSYIERQGEDTHVKRARLLYQSRKRGMLENGLLLSTFADRYLNSFDQKQLQLYDRLINLPSNDWDIFYWATGVKPVPAEFDHEVMNLLKRHIQNEDRRVRIMQPDL